MVGKKIFLLNVLSLFLLYLNIVFTFAVLYVLIDHLELGHIQDHYCSFPHPSNKLELIARSTYFSATTLLSVGYGDVTPLGLSRGVAVLEAMLGYILPATLVVRYSLFSTHSLSRLLNKLNRKK